MIFLHGRRFLSLAFQWLLPISSFLTQSCSVELQFLTNQDTLRLAHYLYSEGEPLSIVSATQVQVRMEANTLTQLHQADMILNLPASYMQILLSARTS